MKPILSDSYGYIDQLDGLNVFEGEKLRIRFPAGGIEEHVVHVEEGGVPSNDPTYYHNAIAGVPTLWRKAFIAINHLGATAKVYLHGLHAERVNPPKHKIGDLVHFWDDRHGNKYTGMTFTVVEVTFRDARELGSVEPTWVYRLLQQAFKTEKPSITNLANPIEVESTDWDIEPGPHKEPA